LKDRGKWRASANINGRKVNLGTFSNVNDAIAARKAAISNGLLEVID